MSSPQTGSQQAPASPSAGGSLSDHEKKTLGLFFGVLAAVSLIFLLMALAGTSGDLLGSSRGSGAYDWMGHARALPKLDERDLPRIFKSADPDNDPMTYDTRRGGPPKEAAMLPSESLAPPPPTMSPEELAALKEQQRKAEEAKQRRQSALKIIKSGDKLLKRNQYPQAKETYLRAAKLDRSLKPEIAERFFQKGKQQERKRSWSRAKTLYRMSLHFDYENSKFHTALAETSQALGDKKKAAEHRRLSTKFRKQGK